MIDFYAWGNNYRLLVGPTKAEDNILQNERIAAVLNNKISPEQKEQFLDGFYNGTNTSLEAVILQEYSNHGN